MDRGGGGGGGLVASENDRGGVEFKGVHFARDRSHKT